MRVQQESVLSLSFLFWNFHAKEIPLFSKHSIPMHAVLELGMSSLLSGMNTWRWLR